MGLYKTKGIVLKSIKFGEADRIVTFYSDSRGRTQAVAKGVRKVGSRFGSRLESFNYLDLLIYEGRGLGTISQTEIITPFRAIREDLTKVLYGMAMLDLIDKVGLAGETDPTLFRFLLESLETLAMIEKHYALYLLAFDLRVVILLGFAPRVGVCVACEQELADRAAFSFKLGGTICMRCRSVDRSAAVISAETYSLLGLLSREEFMKTFPEKVVEDYPREAEGVIQRYMQYYLGTRLLSRKYLRKSVTSEQAGT